MTRYQVHREPPELSIELTDVAGHQQELLEAFQECQDGRCSCPTDEYRKVASMNVRTSADRITIQLESRPGLHLDPSEIEACLDHTVSKVESGNSQS